MTRGTGASEPVGTLHAIVLDVNDLENCVGFRSEVLGKETSFKTHKHLPDRRRRRPTLAVASKGNDDQDSTK